MRLISADSLIEAFDTEHYFDWYTPNIIEKINEQPTVDAEPVVHGEWFCIDPEVELYACSECANRILRRKTKYCANCGARMKKE